MNSLIFPTLIYVDAAAILLDDIYNVILSIWCVLPPFTLSWHVWRSPIRRHSVRRPFWDVFSRVYLGPLQRAWDTLLCACWSVCLSPITCSSFTWGRSDFTHADQCADSPMAVMWFFFTKSTLVIYKHALFRYLWCMVCILVYVIHYY